MFKTNSKILILFFLLSSSQIFAQTEITRIEVEKKEAPKSYWNSLDIKPSQEVKIYFAAVSSDAQANQISYRVLLNGNIIESKKNKIGENYIELQGLAKGFYIVKILANSISGSEYIPATINFNVAENTQNAAPNEKEMIVAANNNMLIYILAGFNIAQFVIIFFLFRRKKTQQVKQPAQAKQTFQVELKEEEKADLRYMNRRLKEEFTKFKDENVFLRGQIRSMEQNIKELEEANVKLLEQKEKLAQSKRNLEELQEKKDELFAMAVHDIKNPVSAIKSYIELLNSYDLNAQEQQEIMTSLMASSNDIMKLTQNICVVLAEQAPDEKYNFEKYPIKNIIDSVCKQNYAYAKSKGVKIINRASTGLPDVKMDSAKIEEVLDNLVNNAIKYGLKETIVEVKSLIVHNKLIVEVNDNGVGLSEADIQKAFAKGSVLGNKPTGDEQSSGLGLWIVKRVIDAHCGRVWVESKTGIGSKFAFELPLE